MDKSLWSIQIISYNKKSINNTKTFSSLTTVIVGCDCILSLPSLPQVLRVWRIPEDVVTTDDLVRSHHRTRSLLSSLGAGAIWPLLLPRIRLQIAGTVFVIWSHGDLSWMSNAFGMTNRGLVKVVLDCLSLPLFSFSVFYCITCFVKKMYMYTRSTSI